MPNNLTIRLRDDVIDRRKRGLGLTRPELCTLLAYAKMTVYEELSAPLIDYYERTGRLIRVSGVGSPEEVFKGVESALHIDG